MLLLSQLPKLDGQDFESVRVAAAYHPVCVEERVGGDFYDVLLLENGGVALFVGDVCGKGLTVASRASEIRYSLRAFLREDPDPAHAVTRVNELLCRCASLEHRNTGSFSTLTLLVLYPMWGTAHLVHAGGEYPLHLPVGGEQFATLVGAPGDGMALGVMPRQTYTAVEIAIKTADIFLLYTDGLTESRQGDTFFEATGIVNAAYSLMNKQPRSGSDMQNLSGELLNRAVQFGDGRHEDDMYLLAAQVD